MRVPKISEDLAQSTPSAPMADFDQYLSKCQYDTPDFVAKAIWNMLHKFRKGFENVVDYGAGDGRFALYDFYKNYIGFEIDSTRTTLDNLPKNAEIKFTCGLSSTEREFDLCIGNPPFVRHHDIDKSWYEINCQNLEKELDFRIDRRSNAFILFLIKAIISTKANGLIALIIPFEWVSRPAAKELREYIKRKKWEVHAYRFIDDIFPEVMTTASITIIDKSKQNSKWSYYLVNSEFHVEEKKFASGDIDIFEYSRRAEQNYAQRGLSPGGQDIFCLSEGQRIHNCLVRGRDVVPCVTTMRHWKDEFRSLTDKKFEELYVDSGMKCWLLKTWEPPSDQLMNYLNAIPVQQRNNYTCTQRSVWWKIAPHAPPDIIYSSAFVNSRPKFLLNPVKAVAVGTVQGIHNVDRRYRSALRDFLSTTDFESRVVAHSGRLRKIEVGQMNNIVAEAMKKIRPEK